MRMKYIRYESMGVVLFEGHIEHKTMNQLINVTGEPVISAGFVSVHAVDDTLEVIASGDSVSLDAKSRPDDADLIKRRIRLY